MLKLGEDQILVLLAFLLPTVRQRIEFFLDLLQLFEVAFQNMTGALENNLLRRGEILGQLFHVRSRGIRPEFASEELAERFFSRTEVSALRALPADMQSEAFFNCWTRKEAYIKARGEGMSLPLNQFNVSLAPGSDAALLGNLRDAAEVLRWSLQELHPGTGYRAAVAVEGHGWKLRCWQ